MRYHTRDRVSIGRRIRNASSPWGPCSLAVLDRTSAVVFTRRRFRLASGKAVGTSPRPYWWKRLSDHQRIASFSHQWHRHGDTDISFFFFFTWQPPPSRQFSVYNSLACLGLYQPSLISAASWGNSLCAIIKDRNALCASGKVQRSSAPLLQLFRTLHATSVSLGYNAVKL